VVEPDRDRVLHSAAQGHRPADFTDREALTRRITEFEPGFNATATPFDWRFTRADLQHLLARIDDQHNGVVLPAAA
jgi:hypothetical protein